MQEIYVQELYKYLKEKNKTIFEVQYVKDKTFQYVIHEVFKETVLKYVLVLIHFQLICDVAENFNNFVKDKTEFRQSKIFLSYIYKIIHKHNLIVKDLYKLAKNVNL